MGASEEGMIRAECEEERWGQLERRVEEIVEAEPDRYAHAKAALEERLGLEGSHYSVSRLRLLEEYNRDEQRGGAD